MTVKINRHEEVHSYSLRNDYSFLEDPASKFYKCIVNEKVDHIDNVVFDVLCIAISVIFNKISIQNMNHNI